METGRSLQTIGTAGHVDHGKSALVQVLTGMNPDRLREEQERGMTIDLGFAWLTLPGGRTVSIVDVPGHEDFIRNMLAGVGGIDAALLVVAADDGVMPQTREHLAILDLLEVGAGVVALNKMDLVEDPEWADLVEADLRDLLQGTRLAEAPIVRVSARTREGIPALLAALEGALDRVPPRPDLGRPRLSIDRVFSRAGFGTVVTGTLMEGCLEVGQELAVYPSGETVRVRGLQVHRQRVERAGPGARVAVNLVNVAVTELRRGMVLALPGSMRCTRLVDARVRMVPHLPRAIRHNEPVELFWGTCRSLGRARLLGVESLGAGETGWVQVRLDQPVPLARGDRFILRQPALNLTLGGGMALDTHPRYHPRFRGSVLQALEAMMRGDPADVLAETLRRREPCLLSEAVAASGLPRDVALAALRQLEGDGRLRCLYGHRASGGTETYGDLGAGADGAGGGSPEDPVVVTRDGWARTVECMTRCLDAYHRQYPLRGGMPREELRRRLKLEASVFDEVLAAAAEEGAVVCGGPTVRLATHEVRFSPAQKAALQRLLDAYNQSPYAPPSRQEAETLAGADVFEALIEQGALVKVSEEFYYLAPVYRHMVDRLVGFLRQHGKVSVAQVRDLFGISRKYILPFLQHLDAIRVTRRVGDDRVLNEAPQPAAAQAVGR